jgi:hypothetical protein
MPTRTDTIEIISMEDLAERDIRAGGNRFCPTHRVSLTLNQDFKTDDEGEYQEALCPQLQCGYVAKVRRLD